MRERNLDDFDAELRGVGIRIGRQIGAATELFLGTNARRARDIDINVVGIVRRHDDGVRMRPAARLYVLDVARMRDISDVEEPDAAHANRAHRFRNALAATVVAPCLPFGRHEQDVLVDRHVAL